LSDGLGSLEYSADAANAAVKGAVEFLLNCHNVEEPEFKQKLLEHCRKEIKATADIMNHCHSKMDCTLLFVVIDKKSKKFVYGQLGEGSVCVVKKNESIKLQTQPNRSDSFMASSNMTKTIQSSDAIEYFNVESYPITGYVGFVLTSDGLENEIYSKAGKAKNNIEWYYNLVSNDNDNCLSKIESRLSELTSDESYGFTDNISLIIIAKKGIEVDLPDDANWLCICKHRNKLESTRCENCDKDFTKLYRGVNFKVEGGKAKVFSFLNDNPDIEISFLHEHNAYDTELSTNVKAEDKEQPVIQQSGNNANICADKPVFSVVRNNENIIKNKNNSSTKTKKRNKKMQKLMAKSTSIKLVV